MRVETYETQIESHPEACEESARLIAELGLLGQERLVNPDTGSRAPYRTWTGEEFEVYGLLLTTHDAVEKFDGEPMPLRVLQVLAHAKSLGIYAGFYVWHNAALKDPILLAYLPGEQHIAARYHILARWGDVFEEFPILRERAAKIKAAQIRAKCHEWIGKAQSKLAELDAAGDAPSLGIKMLSEWS